MKIDKDFLQRYILEIKELNPTDDAITASNILIIFHLIHKKAKIEELFHSSMTYYSVFILLRKAYLEQLINFDHKSIHFINNNIILEKVDFHFPHLADVNYSGDHIELAKQIVENKNFEESLEYYQTYSDFDSLKRRFRLMSHHHDSSDKSIIFLGDDDLYSLFYALNANAKEIAVVDVDERILNYIREMSEKYGLNIKTYHADLLDEIPKELHGKFDLFFTSGFKDLGGLMIFITTGLMCLKETGKKSGYFAYYEHESDKLRTPYEHQLQHQLIGMNCYLDAIISCDEAIIPDSVLDKTMKLLQEKKELKLQEDYLKYVKNKLKEDNPLAADPNFPIFSVKPIKLARINTTGVKNKVPETVLKRLKAFYKMR